MFRTLFIIFKKIFFWPYPRNTWQYDILCLLILVFVFFTPPAWYETRMMQKNRLANRQLLLVPLEPGEEPLDNQKLQTRVKQITGHSEVHISNVRTRTDQRGTVVGYEVDLH